MKLLKLLAALPLLIIGACSSHNTADDPELPGAADPSAQEAPSDTPIGDFKLCKGADISWLTEMEDRGVKFYPKNGPAGDCLVILKDLGVNAVRLRVWVNPPNRYNTLEDVLEKCRRASQLGLDIMIDFHYSDSWADPSQQTTPAAWSGYDIDALVQAVGEYTRGSLSILKDEGIDVKWVQVGNETGNGMLWPLGQADRYPKNYVRLTNAGYEAVKSVYPRAKVIVHVQNGQDLNLAKWLYNILESNGGKYDVAGFSLYPDRSNYEDYVAKARETMTYVVEKYGKEVMLCEVGMPWNQAKPCYNFLKMCFDLMYEMPGDSYLGALYWEPECYPGWNGYQLGAFNSVHRPTEALDAYSIDYSGVPMVKAD